MYVVRKVGVLSFAKLFAFIFALIGVVAGILVASLGNTVTSTISEVLAGTGVEDKNPLEGLSIFLWISAFTLSPLAFSIIGFITGAIVALGYNILAKTGGLRLDLSDEEEQNISMRNNLLNQTTTFKR